MNTFKINVLSCGVTLIFINSMIALIMPNPKIQILLIALGFLMVMLIFVNSLIERKK